MPSPARKFENLVLHGPWWKWDEDSGVMRMFTDPVCSKCNQLYFWGLHVFLHPLLLLLLILAYQTLNVFILGATLLSLRQLREFLTVWLEVTSWLGLVAPVGLLMWIYGGFLYRQTEFKIFALEHSSNQAWHAVNLAGVAVRCFWGAFVFSNLYPALLCVLTKFGLLGSLWSGPGACWHGSCNLLFRLGRWLAHAVDVLGVGMFTMHWFSWWYFKPVWCVTDGYVVLNFLRFALSLALPVAAVLGPVVALDPDHSVEHSLLVLSSFAFTACSGQWAKWLQKKSLGWAVPFLTAMTAALLGFAISFRAMDWHYDTWFTEESPGRRLADAESTDTLAAGDGAVAAGVAPCLGLHGVHAWLHWVRTLNLEERVATARKARSLAMCVISLPACAMSFLGSVHSRGSRPAPDACSIRYTFFAILSVLLGAVTNVLVRRHLPQTWEASKTWEALGLELLRWFAVNALCILAVLAFKLYLDPLLDTTVMRCLCRFSMIYAPLCVAFVCAYLAAALHHGSLNYLQFNSWQAVKTNMRQWLEQDARQEAVHIILFLVVMVPLTYIARTAYWRRHWHKRWHLTPLDHQGLFGVHGLSIFLGILPDYQAHGLSALARKVEQLNSGSFWEKKQRLIYGTRARLLHFRMPLVGLTFWQKLKLYRQSFMLTVQATTVTLWRYMDRLGDVKGFAPPIVASSQVLCLWFPAAFARTCRLGLILFLWYGEYLPGFGRSTYVSVQEDTFEEMKHEALPILEKDAIKLREGASTWSGTWSFLTDGHFTSEAKTLFREEEDVAQSSFMGLALVYRYALLVNVTVACVVALYWKAVGLFTLSDSVKQAFIIFIDSDSQVRKLLLLRGGNLSSVVKITWMLLSVVTQCLQPVRKVLQNRYWMNSCVLLDILLQNDLVPSCAHLLAVSGADLKDSLMYNSMLLDSALAQSMCLALSTALSMLGRSRVTHIDVFMFTLQFFLMTIKGPLDAHSLRLMRLRAICDAIQKQRDEKPMTVWGIAPGSCGVHFVNCEPADNVGREAVTWLQKPEKDLVPESSLRDDIGWSLSFSDVAVRLGWFRTQRRLAVNIHVPDENLWAVWTLQIEGTHRWFRRREGGAAGVRSASASPKAVPASPKSGGSSTIRSPTSAKSPSDNSGTATSTSPTNVMRPMTNNKPHTGQTLLEGQWVRWYDFEVRASTKQTLRIQGLELHRPELATPEKLEVRGERSCILIRTQGEEESELDLDGNDWGLMTISDGTQWVRTGPEALVEGLMYNDIHVWTRFDCFSSTTGMLTFQHESRTLKKTFTGHWQEDYHVFELDTDLTISFWKDDFTVLRLQFKPGAVVVFVRYDHSISPVSWTLTAVAEKVENHFSQTFTGELLGGPPCGMPSPFYSSWWWAKLTCNQWQRPLEGHACMADTRDHPRFRAHKGPGRLVIHWDPEARDAASRTDNSGNLFYLGNEWVQVERVTLVLHAVTKEFREPTCLEWIDPSERRYTQAAEDEGYVDNLGALSSPVELHTRLWPEVDRSAELTDDGASGYMQVSFLGPPEEDSFARGVKGQLPADV